MCQPAQQGRLSRSRSPRQSFSTRSFATRDGGKKESDRKERENMNHQIQAEKERALAMRVETDAAERDQLAQCGLSTEEIVAFLWLRRWYQTGGRDRVELLRHSEFLQWLVRGSLLESPSGATVPGSPEGLSYR